MTGDIFAFAENAATNHTKNTMKQKQLKRGIGGLKMRLIDADKLDFSYCDNEFDCIFVVEKAPTVDAAPIRYGHKVIHNRPLLEQWITRKDILGEKHTVLYRSFIENNPVEYCSECGAKLDDTWKNYCPNCGAKMDGERSKE